MPEPQPTYSFVVNSEMQEEVQKPDYKLRLRHQDKKSFNHSRVEVPATLVLNFG